MYFGKMVIMCGDIIDLVLKCMLMYWEEILVVFKKYYDEILL